MLTACRCTNFMVDAGSRGRVMSGSSGPSREAKISGRAIAAGPVGQGSDSDRFHADIAEVVHTHLNDKATRLVIEWWTPTHGLRRVERE